MRLRRITGNIVPIALVCAGIYIALNWQSLQPGESETERSAKDACVEATRSRYDVTSARAYQVRENSNGYTVLVTVVQKNGDPAQVTCLTSARGNVRDVSIDVR
jgi:hypothetical protein